MGHTLPETASIVYYQKKRHIFGNLKVDIYDDKGTLLTSLQGDKRRGLNRARDGRSAPSPQSSTCRRTRGKRSSSSTVRRRRKALIASS